MRRLASLGLLTLLACGDSTGSGTGPVRFRALQGDDLVLFAAPPLRELRRISLVRGDTILTYAGPAADGGFYARAWSQSQPGTEWRLVRFDGDWRPVASRRRDELVAESLGTGHITLTPDSSLLVVQLTGGFPAVAGQNDVLVLDPVTLALVRRLPAGSREFLFPGRGPTATAGTEVIWRNDPAGGCPRSLIWLDVAVPAVIDSVEVPCLYSFRGARTRRLLYLFDQRIPGQVLRLVDASTGAVIASAPDTLPSFDVVADAANNQLVVRQSSVVLLDAATLALRDVLLFQAAGAPPSALDSGVIDPGTETYIAPVCVPRPAEQGFGCRQHLVVIVDLARRRIANSEEISAPVIPVP